MPPSRDPSCSLKMPTRQKCGLCDRQFTRTEHLARHIRSHTKQKPFACLVCGKTYVREDTLTRHARSHRSDGIQRDTVTVQRSASGPQISSAFNDTTSQELSPGPLSVPIAPPQYMLDQNAEAHGTNLTMVNLSTNPTSHQRDFQDLFGPMIESWDFGDSAMMEMFETEAAGDRYSVDRAHLALEYEPTQNVKTLRGLSKWGVSRAGSHMESPVLDLRKMWFTRIPAPEEDSTTHPLSPAQSPSASVSNVTDISDQYRHRLSNAMLNPLQQDDPVPSSDFLNQCVQMYFHHFNPVFPALHHATFRPTTDNGFLLLSIASIGCLFMGSKTAVRLGKQIWLRLNKAILQSLENTFTRSTSEMLAILQAIMIGQTFALLSGEQNHIATFEMFHGTLITLVRRAGFFASHAAVSATDISESSDLEKMWRTWARLEEKKRLHASLRIHDAEMSVLLHCEPLLGKNAGDPPQLATNRMFLANTASEWASIVQGESDVEIARDDGSGKSFRGYVALERLGSSMAEDRRHGHLDKTAVTRYHESLANWYNRYFKFATIEEPDQLCIMMLWHWTYMSSLVDFDQLERAIGRDGPETARSANEYVSSWVSSPDSTRCVLHAFLLQKQLELVKFDQVLAIHVPRITFAAAIAWYCYLQHGTPENVGSLIGEMAVHFPELSKLGSGTSRQLSEIPWQSWRHGTTSMIKAATLCKLGILLQRMVHWGITERFAELLTQLIHS